MKLILEERFPSLCEDVTHHRSAPLLCPPAQVFGNFTGPSGRKADHCPLPIPWPPPSPRVILLPTATPCFPGNMKRPLQPQSPPPPFFSPLSFQQANLRNGKRFPHYSNGMEITYLAFLFDMEPLISHWLPIPQVFLPARQLPHFLAPLPPLAS